MKQLMTGFFTCFLWFAATGLLLAQNMDSVEGDKQALQDLYHATDGDNWNKNTGWLHGDPSDEWFGVRVNQDGRVTAIKLNGSEFGENGIWGGNNLKGELPESIGNLKELTYLNLKQNFLTGELPQAIGNLVKLKNLHLNGHSYDPHEHRNPNYNKFRSLSSNFRTNRFSGAIPSSFGNLANLEYLELLGIGLPEDEVNDGSGHPGVNSIPMEIGNLTNLKGLYLNFNNISNLPASMQNLENLVHLFIGRNAFAGLNLPPWFSNLVQIKSLDIEANRHGGTFPNLSSWKKLSFIWAARNNFKGDFPAYLLDGSHPHINMMEFAWNDFSGSFPEIRGPNNLNAITLDGNGLSGEIHPSWGTDASKKITNFSFGWNNLEGSIPDLEHAYQLRYIRALNNNFTGKLPKLHTNNESLANLWFSGNNFTGPIDSTIIEAIKNGRSSFGVFQIGNNNFCQEDIDQVLLALDNLSKQVDFSYGSQDSANCQTENSRDSTSTELFPPDLDLPIDNAEGVSINSNLVWEETNSESYRLQLTKSDFSNPILDVEVTELTYLLENNIEYEQTYQWRVKALQGDEESDWSNEWNFTVEENPYIFPAPPVLNGPDHKSGDVALTPEFTWSDNGSDYYILHVSRLDPTGMITDVVVEDTTYTPEEIFDDSTIHDWRVRGVKDGELGEWSDIRRFTTREVGLPEVAELVSPGHFSDNVNPALELVWDDVTADSYKIRLWNKQTNDTLFTDISTIASYKPSDILPDTTEFVWQVKSISGGVQGAWGPRWEFSTGAYTYSVEAPSLIAPDPGSEYDNLTPVFEWSEVDADHYIIEVSLEVPSNAKSISGLNTETSVIIDEISETKYMPQNALDPDTRYYWRVQAVKNGEEGEWSEIWEFTTPDSQHSVSIVTGEKPFQTSLAQNYPNPFNPSTQIEFTLSAAQNVTLRVYDMAGRQVATLVEGVRQAGRHTSTFTGDNLASGIYLYRFMSDTHQFTKKMTLVK